jgi:hypothetical protein
MKRRVALAVLSVVALVALAGLGSTTSAAPGENQTSTGEPWTGARGITVSTAQLMARQRAADWGLAGQGSKNRPEPHEEPVPNGGEEPVEPHGPPKGPGSPTKQTRLGEAAIGPQSNLTTGTSFLGARRLGPDGAVFRPPDSMGAVGPTQVLVIVNGRIRVFDKDGSNHHVLDMTDSQFWAPVNNLPDVTDPEVEYDRLSQRWVLSQINFDHTQPSLVNNRIMLAVSDSATITPTTTWTYHFFTQNGPNPAATARFADYPQMGVDKNAIYIGTNEFSSSGPFTGTTAYVIRKSTAFTTGSLTVTAFRGLVSSATGPGPFTPQPATDMDPNVNAGYIVGVDNANFSTLDVIRINNPRSDTPTKTTLSPLSVPTTVFPDRPSGCSSPNFCVPAQGSNKALDALDDRLYEAMIGRDENGTLSLWTAHNIEVNSSGVGSTSGGRDGARWYQLGNLGGTPNLIQSGTLFDTASSNPRYFWIPSIAMNGQGHASLNASTSASNKFAGIASSAHLASETSGTTEPFDLVQSGVSYGNTEQGNDPSRWGDYSQTVVDPTDNQTFWTFQEYAFGNTDWGLRVVKIMAPPPATPASASPTPINGGQASQNVTITGDAGSNGAGFFDPVDQAGAPPWQNHIDATVSGGVTVNSVTYTNPTHVTLNLSTVGAPDGPKDVTITNPDGQSATGSNILVVGTDTTPPDPPVLTGTDPTSPSNVNTPKVQGSAEGGSTVRLYTDSACTAGPVGSGSAATFGSTGVPVTVPVADDSTTTFYATATDISDNTSDCSTTSVTYVEDSIPPGVPTGLAVTPSSPSQNPNPVVSGTADVGTTVKLYNASTTSNCTPANLLTSGTAADFASPGLTATVPANSTTTFRATATDDAGNESACSSDSVVYVEDQTKPAAPTGLASTPPSPANNNDPMVSGSAENGSTVRLYKADTTSDCSAANLLTTDSAALFASPGFGVSVPDDSTTTFRATATDSAGNTSDCSSSSVVYQEDSTRPQRPSVLASSPPSPANDTTPRILGTAESLSTVRLYTDAACTPPVAGTGTAAAFASPGIQVSVSPNTSTTFYATATDQAGNVSDCSTSSFTYVDDSTLPTVPAITATNPASPSTSTTPRVIGAAGLNTAQVDVFTRANCAGGAATGSRGQFVGSGIQVSVGANQRTLLSARARNANGTSACSTSFAYTNLPPGTVPPPQTSAGAPPETLITKGPKKKTRKRRPKFKFTSSEPGSTFLCKLDRKKFKPCSSPYRPPKKLKPGKHKLKVKAVDAAGNADGTPAVRKFKVIR